MEWQPVLREVHLYGGGRALNCLNSTVDITPKTVNGKHARVKLKNFGGLYSDLIKLGLNIVGCDFFTSTESAEGSRPPEWRSRNVIGPAWLCTDQGNEWSFIAHAAFKQKNGLLYDIASRISHQLRACEWRLRQLSEAYADQLKSRISSKPFKDGQRFLDGYTSLCYLALQAFLVDACVLRDYLAEFYFETSPQKDASNVKKITTMAGLIKSWKGAIPPDAAGKEIMASTKPRNWLFELGAYRDLVIHTAPLAKAGQRLYAVTRSFVLLNNEQLPGIKLPLPSDPAGLKSARSSGRYFQDPELNFARARNIIDDIENTKDSLEYAHICMQLLSTMSSSVSKNSPIKPEVPIITSADTIGGIKITRE
ncbi:MAG: hypothetical protein ACKVK5_07365 [Pseudomonadales bacterium]